MYSEPVEVVYGRELFIIQFNSIDLQAVHYFTSLCKLAYGGPIGLNQEIVLCASSTGVVLLLNKVLLISV